MDKMKKIVVMVAVLVLTSLTLVACGKPDISGKWYSTDNSNEFQMYLQIKDDKVTLNYAFVNYTKEGLFSSVESEVKSGKMLTGKVISGSKIEITETYQVEGAKGNPFDGVEEFNYSLSKDKESLSLSIEGEESSSDFVKKNPVATLE